MNIGEIIDKLTDRIIGRHFIEQFLFMYPTKRQLVSGDLNPYRINSIRGYGLDISDHDMFMAMQGDGVFLFLFANGCNFY